MLLSLYVENKPMAQEDYKEYICGRICIDCIFQVRAKTEAEVMAHAKLHATEAHGVKELSHEMEKKIKANITSAKAEKIRCPICRALFSTKSECKEHMMMHKYEPI